MEVFGNLLSSTSNSFLGNIFPRHMTRERGRHAVRSNHILDISHAPISLSASLMRSAYVDRYNRLPVFPGLFLFLPRSAHKYRTSSRMERWMQLYPQESLNVCFPRFCLWPGWSEEAGPCRVIWCSHSKILLSITSILYSRTSSYWSDTGLCCCFSFYAPVL